MATVTDIRKHEAVTAVRLIGSSMGPTLPLGTRVEIEPCRRPMVGQVALLQSGPHLILHRLAGRFSIGGETWFLHTGDNNPVPGLVRREDIVGFAPEARPFPLPVGTRVLSLGLLLFSAIGHLGFNFRTMLSRPVRARWVKNMSRFVSFL